MTNILNENGSADNSVPREDTRLLGNDQPTTSYSVVNDVDEEGQRTGDEEQQRSMSRRISLIVIAMVLSTTVLATAWFATHYISLRKRSYRPYGILNNGTNDFRQTLVMISLDGTVNDYLDLGVTPNLDAIAAQGVRAQYMNPAFPSITFPNHWTLVTGLYPESHGIVGNVFYDPVLNQTFNYKSPAHSWDDQWWGGEPIWITSELQNITSAVTMWPGCSVVLKGTKPTYEIPYDDDAKTDDKMDQVLRWLDLPFEERPQSINVYIPTVDQYGHKYGPYDNRTLSALHDVDASIGRLLSGLADRHLSDIVHVIVVSDHGMGESDNSRLIYYDDILDDKALNSIWKTEGWPSLGIRTYPGREEAIENMYNQLYNHSLTSDAQYDVYLRADMPPKYHISNNERIPPLVAIPRPGWNFVTHTQFNDPSKVYEPRGVHGYDNFARQSRAIFVAKGPLFDWDFERGQRLKPFMNIEVYGVLSRILGLVPATNNGTLSGYLKALE